VLAAERQLDGFAERLEREGVRVVRPDPVDHRRRFSTPNWTCRGGLYSGMPRDLLMVVGDIIVEAPMSWRCRYNEIDAYRPLIKEYFRRGARWLPAPRSQLTDELFDASYDPHADDEHADGLGGIPLFPRARERYAITEFEPVFDAADFVRFVRDILVQRSHVTNELGIRWLEQAVGDDFTLHCVDVNDPHAMHIDATIVPLAPGKLLVNGERFVTNELVADWEIREAPRPTARRAGAGGSSRDSGSPPGR
jgi:glycine amidinotransferase